MIKKIFSFLLFGLFFYYYYQFYKYEKIFYQLEVENQRQIQLPHLHILTFATDIKERGLHDLLSSSPFKINILGKGKTFRDLRDKLYAVKEYIEQNGLIHSQDIILFTDGYDTVFTKNYKYYDLIEKFRAFNKPVIFSAETNCYPAHLPICVNQDLYPVAPTKYRYLNSGGYIGEASFIYKMLELSLGVTYNIDNNDQYLTNMVFVDNQDWIGLDYFQEIFCTLYQTSFEDYSGPEEKVQNLSTGSYPIILHGNGKYIMLLKKLYNLYK